MSNADAGTLALLFGNSHANCMVRALRHKLFPTSADGFSVRIVSTGSDAFPGGLVLVDSLGRRVANPVVTRAIDQAIRESEREGRNVWLLSVIGGNFANRLSLFRTDGDIDFLDPDEDSATQPEVADADRYVPYDLLEAQLQSAMSSLGEFLRLLPMGRVAGLTHVDGPPPVPDANFIVENLPERTKDLARAAGEGEITAATISPARFRYKVWRAQSRVARRMVEAAGGHYMSAPPAALDSEGYRRLELCADAAHGTTEYGALCLEAIRSSVTGLLAERAHHE
ncbi:MAG: hypothetical protein H6983_19130 [Ectothiorhodospiraceae bacterium]|nr:hypothetical protein [Ectothiorhodospiraceae bacterium]